MVSIDTISRGDNTGTAQALALGYNELYKTNLPGAFNILLFFTDGIPNSMTLNFSQGGAGSQVMMATSGCKDSSGKALSAGGNFKTKPPSWTSGWTMPSGSFFASIPAGPIGVVASDDPSSSGSYGVRFYQGTSQSQTNHGTIGSGTAVGCAFTNGTAVAPGKGGEENYVDDFQLLPPKDAWGSALQDATYNNLSVDVNGNIKLTSNPDTGTQLTGNNLTFHLAARNAANAMAITARSNATIPATIFGVGLGGTSQAPPGYDFMQRITNDPNGDLYNSPALYSACAQVATCAHYAGQPQGVFIFSSDPTQLEHVFVVMASEILRLAK